MSNNSSGPMISNIVTRCMICGNILEGHTMCHCVALYSKKEVDCLRAENEQLKARLSDTEKLAEKWRNYEKMLKEMYKTWDMKGVKYVDPNETK